MTPERAKSPTASHRPSPLHLFQGMLTLKFMKTVKNPPPSPKPHLLFAGQGGGALGCFPVGALLEYFDHPSQPYDGGFGVSVSALILARLMASDNGTIPDFDAQKENVRILSEMFESLTGNESIYVPWPRTRFGTWALAGPIAILPVPKEVRHALIALLEKRASVYDTEPLVTLVRESLSGKSWHESVRVGVVKLATGSFEEISLGNNEKWLDSIVASTAIPIAFPPITAMIDGGVTDITPLKGVFRRFRELRTVEPNRPQELHVYRCSPFPDHANTKKSYRTIPAVASRMLDIMLDNTDEEDFSSAVFYNRLAEIASLVMASSDEKLKEKFAVWNDKYGKVAIYVISPIREDAADMPEGSRVFDPAKIRSGMARGRSAMKSFLLNKESYRLEKLFNR
jgi:hypothetical protein